ncbi:MAG: trypsin-like peptidase domain-containing protein [Akkermansiaceae bacterium]|nr:trypsin-like peptidase domain-containing protein [Verrucomicrobiales bacterium]
MKAAPALLLALASVVPNVPNALFSAETNRPHFDLVRQLNEAFVQVAESVSPAVVVLTVTEKAPVFAEPTNLPGTNRLAPHPRFHHFEDEPLEGKGSGIIIRKDGYILTNGHVVEDAEKIQVRLLDGRTFTATVRGVDTQSDVAVIKIEADGDLPVARLGDSSKVRVGEFAIAIGAPFSLDYTVTYGHISAKSRGNVVPFFLGGQMMDQDFLQTDANIHPGNSGGPLVNIEGEVVGVNNMIQGMRTGIGFAIPINLAKDIAERLITHGKFVRSWLGIEIRALSDDPEVRERVKTIKSGVIVQSILPHGPAANSNLRASDIITAVDGKPVSTAQQLRNEIRGKLPGQPVTLDVFRSSKAMIIKVNPGEYTPTPAAFAPEVRPATTN